MSGWCKKYQTSDISIFFSSPDLTRSQTFDDGEGEDLDEVFKSGTCPSTSAATPTDHAPLAPPVTSKQSPQASREVSVSIHNLL